MEEGGEQGEASSGMAPGTAGAGPGCKGLEPGVTDLPGREETYGSLEVSQQHSARPDRGI